MKTLKRLMFLAIVALISSTAMAQSSDDWRKWEQHDVRAFYVEIDEDDADEYSDAEEFGGRWFIPTRISSGEYSVTVYEKVESRLWSIRGTRYFVLFRYNPYLYRYDEGVLVSNGRNGTFYKKE